MCFGQNLLQLAKRQDFAIHEHFQPEYRLIRFFDYDSYLCNPFRLGSGAACGPIVCRNRCSTAQQLLPENLRISSIRQGSVDSNHTHCKGSSSFSKLFLLRSHSG